MADGQQANDQTQFVQPSAVFEGTAVEDINALSQDQRAAFEAQLSPEEYDAFQSFRSQAGIADLPVPPPENIQSSASQPAQESFTSSDIKVPESLISAQDFKLTDEEQFQLIQDLNVSELEQTQKPIETIQDTQLRDVAISSQNRIIETSHRSAEDTSVSNKQRRTLSERQDLMDHYDVDMRKESDGSVTVGTRTTGSVHKGKSEGRTQRVEFRVTPQQALDYAARVTQYAAHYEQMTPMQRAIGGTQLFFDAARPFFRERVIDPESGKPIIRTVPEFAQIASVVDGLSVYNQWGNLNNVDRFRYTANQFVNTARSFGYDDAIPADAVNGLGLINFGYAAYNLLNNWDNMSPIDRAVGIIHTINSGAQAYTAGSALVNSLSGTAATGAAAGAGASAGASAGAAAQGGQAAAATAGGGSTASVAGSVATYAGYAAAVYSAYQIVDNWGQGGNASSRAAGASQGASIGMTIGGIYGAAIGAVIGLAIGSINAGKSGPQRKRDALRDHFVNQEIFERDQNGSVRVQLKGGDFYDVGVDGGGSTAKYNGADKTYANPDRIAERDKESVLSGNRLRPYDIDYTNDLDYITHLATKGVNLLPVGGTFARRTSEVDQVNGLLTNAATSDTGREWTRENFSSVMENVRGFYGKMGITSFEQGMEVIQKMRDDKRLSQDDFNSISLGLEFAFNNNFDRAQQLLQELRRDEAPVNIPKDEYKELQQQDREDVDKAQADRDRKSREQSGRYKEF